MDDSVVATIETQISTLSGVSMVLTTEDLQRWTTICKEDKGHIAAYCVLHGLSEACRFFSLYLCIVGSQPRTRQPSCSFSSYLQRHARTG